MSDKTPNLDSLFEAAIRIESVEERAAFVEQQCGDNAPLRAQLEQLLASDERAGSFLEKPPADLEATIATDRLGEHRAASLHAGLASAFDAEQAVVLGRSDHSVLRSLGQTIDIPLVSLREAEGEGETPLEQPSSPEIPSTSAESRYRVDGEIARGGMGAILKGRDTDLGRDLAIKVLLDEHKDRPEVIQRFIEEAQIGGQLQHPGIAPVYELGQFADKRPFFSMKLVKGQTLSKLLSARKTPVDDRSRYIGIFEQVCQTLSYAHARGVIHRDLKPSNIMVGAFGEVQVMDWGLAKVLTSGGVADEKTARSRHHDVSVIETRRSAGSGAPGSVGSGSAATQMGSVLGTPAYMPPEQALGEIDQLDQRTDVFGLGAILCEILTGKPPYVGEDATAVFRMASRGKLENAFERLEACGADPELIVLAKECLAGEPHHRPRDAGVVAERVAHYLESVELKLRQAEQERAAEAARVDEQRKRLRVTLALGAVVGAVLIAGIAGTTWFALKARHNFTLAEARANDERTQRLRANDAEQLANQRLAAETAATRRAEAAVKASRQSLFDLNTSFGLTAADYNRPAEALLWFAEAASHAELGSHQEQSCLIRHASWIESTPRLLHFIEHDHQQLRSTDYSPQGRYFAALAESGQSLVWDIEGRATQVFSDGNIVDQVWHAEQSWLVMATQDGSVRVIAIPSGEVLHEIDSSEPVAKIACDPRGQNVALGGNSIQLWDVSKGSLSTIGKTENAGVQSLTFSQDGSLVLASYDDHHARAFSTRSGAQSQWQPIPHQGTGFPGAPILRPVFVNGGRRVLTKLQGAKVLWTDLDNQPDSREIPFEGVHLTSITPGPDGKFVLTNQGGVYQIWDDRSAEALTTGRVGQEVGDTAFTPDGLDILFMTKHGVHRRRVIDGERYGSSIEHSIPLRHLRVSPDGRQVAIADVDGAIAIWEWGTYLPQYLHAETQDRTSVLNGRARQRLLSASGTRVKRSSSGDYFLVCGGNYIFGTMRRVTLRSSEDGAVVDAMHSDSLVMDACIAPDDQTLALANLDHKIFVWKRGAPESKRLLVTTDAEPMHIEFGPDERTLIVLQIDGATTCFDTMSGNRIWQSSHPEVVVPSHRRQKNLHMYRRPNGFPIMSFQAYNMLISADRRYCATTCRNDMACVWNSRDGSLRTPPIRFTEGNIERIALSSDGRWLALAGVKTAEVWDLSDATLQQRFDISALAAALVFDTSGQRLAICVETGECHLWDWQSHELSCPPIRGTKGVFFGEGDRWFWTDRGPGGSDHFEAVLWSAVSGTPLTPSWAIPRPPGNFGGPSPTSSPDQRTWHFTAGSFNISILLDQLLDPAPSSIDQRRLEAEILAVQRIDTGKAVTLTPAEWRRRIESMQASHPDFFTSRWDDQSRITWHEDQRYRGLRDRNSHAAQWHLNELRKMLGDQYADRLSHEAEVHFFAALDLAQADAMDEAAGRIRRIAVEQAEWFLAFLNFGELEYSLKESVDLIDRLRSAGHDDEAMLVFELMRRAFAARFGPGDSRLRDIGYDLCVDYWERGLRSRSIAYFARIAPEEPTLAYRSQLILMRLAAGHWQAAEPQVRSLVGSTNPEQANAETLRIIAQTTAVFATRDAALAERVLDFATRAAAANAGDEAMALVTGLAQLRSGKTEAALDGLRKIPEGDATASPLSSAAYSAITLGLLRQGDIEAAQAALQSARSAMPAEPERQQLRPDVLIAEALLLEATRHIQRQH